MEADEYSKGNHMEYNGNVFPSELQRDSKQRTFKYTQ